MSESTGRSWRRLLDEKRAAFTKQGCEIPVGVTDEACFRNAFEDLCRSYKERYYTRLLVQLRYGTINAFASAVDGAFEHVPPHSLGALVVGGCFVAIQHGCKARLQLSEIAEMLGQLNSVFPPLGHDIPRFTYDPDVQTPLQVIFDIYMDSLLFIIRSLNLEQTPPSRDFDRRENIEANIQEAAARFESGRTNFKLMLERSERNDTRGVNTPWSFPGTQPDVFHHPYDTQARFIPLRKLGRGSFGDVDEVQEVSTRAVYARKMIQLPNRSAEAIAREEDVRAEVSVMQRLSHFHIAKVLFWLKEPGACSIFMAPAGDRDLRVHLESCVRDGYPSGALQNILPWFGCLLDALDFAHRLHIVHRDIKPSNILIKDMRIYLADFGLAKYFTEYGASRTSSANVRGTPIYRAPEVRPDHPRGRPADVFSLGCVYSEMLTVCCGRSLDEYQDFRRAPDDECQLAFRANLPKVQRWLNQLRDDRSDDTCDTLVYQILKMLREDSEMRPLAQDAVKFLKDNNQRGLLFCAYH